MLDVFPAASPCQALSLSNRLSLQSAGQTVHSPRTVVVGPDVVAEGAAQDLDLQVPCKRLHVRQVDGSNLAQPRRQEAGDDLGAVLLRHRLVVVDDSHHYAV